ncbi:MAG: OsmC family protein [Williamsia sp.]|nr:OsmC family protein [Williamsia sp.]
MTSTVVYSGNLRTLATHLQSGTQIETDAPVDNQGQGERFSPSDLVATALGSCMMTIMGIKARDLNIDLEDTRIEILKKMSPDPRRITGIDLTFHFPEHLRLAEKERTILERAAHTCPVIYSIHPDIKVEVVMNWEAVNV